MRKALLLSLLGVLVAGCERSPAPERDRSSIMERPHEVEADPSGAASAPGPEAETAPLGPAARPALAPSSPPSFEEPPTSPSGDPASDPPVPSGPRLPPERFAPMLEEVQEREEDADFAGALALARRMRAGFDGRPEGNRASALVARLEEAKSISRDVAFAVETLGSDDPGELEYAESMLARAGPTGAVFLRRALQNESTPLAQRATLLLLKQGDEEAKDAIAEVLVREPGTPLGQELLAAWVEVYGQLPGPALAAVYRVVADDADHARRGLFGYLAEAYRNHCAEDAAQFASLVRDPEAPAVLRRYVDRALQSGDGKLVRWAWQYGYTFGSTVAGLRGEYFEGSDFEKLVHERVDPGVCFCSPPETNPSQSGVPRTIELPFEGAPLEHVSARWTGKLLVPRSGSYTFHVATDDGYRLWIDEKLVGEAWSESVTPVADHQVDLSVGPHPFRLEWCQGTGGYFVKLEWTGPGIERQFLPPDAFQTLPVGNEKRGHH